MRVKTRYNPIVACSLILLFAIFIFCFALTLPAASADATVYLEADVTVGGDFLPSVLTYTGSDYSFGFNLYKSEDRSSWEKDTDVDHLSNFSLKFYDLEDNLLPFAPIAEGTYYARVVANDVLFGYKNNDADPRVIAGNVVVGEKRFSIAYQTLSLFCAPLDGADSLVLDDTHSDYYSAVTSGASLYLAGSPLTLNSDYTLTVQYYNENSSSYETATSISKVGVYRLKAKIDSSVNLSRTIAPYVLSKEGSDTVFYREFSVTRASVSLALTRSSMYEDGMSAVTLTAESKTKLAAIAAYNTQVIRRSSTSANGEMGRVLASLSGNAVSYTPTEVGAYVYRVTFIADSDGYGVSLGDYVDVPFTVKQIPYTVSYWINNDETNVLDYAIKNSGSGAIQLTPVFYNAQGGEIRSVYTDVGDRKFTVSYEVYNTALSAWQAATPQEAGRYRVVVHFNADAQIVSGEYTITSGSDLKKEFQIITSGSLSLDLANGGVNYYTGSPVVPAILFLSPTGDASALVEGKYSLEYFDNAGVSLGSVAPSSVGKYSFEVKFTQTVPELGVAVGAVYRGAYTLKYRTLEVAFGESVTFRIAETGEKLPLVFGADYTVEYYERSGNIVKLLSAAPSVPGAYLEKVIFSTAISLYRIAAGDFSEYSYSIAGVSAMCDISTSSVDLTYDGGRKVPVIAFSKGTSSLALSELTDYQVSYFRYDNATESFLPCGETVFAGTYKAIVTFLVSDDGKGLIRGANKVAQYTIAPREITATFTVSEASSDLVYDAENKTFDVSFKRGTRPVSFANAVTYAVADATPAFGSTPFVNAGDYLVKSTLADDHFGSLSLVGATQPFTIEKLPMTVNFTVPLSYRAMWTGSAVEPVVKYTAVSGRHRSEDSRTAAQFAALGIALSENKSFYATSDGIHYDTAVSAPIKTGSYREEVASGNVNILLQSATALGDDGSVVTTPYLTAGKANQIFSVIPREVEVKPTFDPDLFYTGSESADRKGVASVKFYAYNGVSFAYDSEVSAFAGDFRILYYPSDYRGTISGEGSETKPTEKSYYVARVVIAADGSNDAYITEERYTLKDGKNTIGGDLAGVALQDDCYVDFIFRIRDQNKLDVIFEMPETFAVNGEAKVISALFLNNFSEVPFEAGDGKDYKITYLDASNNEQAEPFTAAGNYRVKLTFLKKNVAYRVNSYSGEYTKANDLYLSANDTIVYDFEIFDPRPLTVQIREPASFYYDGRDKSYAADFSVREGGAISTVTLTYGTHYKICYYEKSGDTYEQLAFAPILPGEYAVEIAFLTDLPDYTIVINGTPTPISTAAVVTLKGANGVYADAKTPRETFTIAKAVLRLSGLTADDKVFDATTSVTFRGTPALTVKTIGDVSCGEMVKVNGVFPYTLEGELRGSFETPVPGEGINVLMESYYTLSEGASDYYDLEYPTFSANISKSPVLVTPVDITREYNPFAVESIIRYSLTYDAETLALLYPTLEESDLLLGELSHEEGTSVGWYPISRNTLSFNDAGAGMVYTDKQLSDLFRLVIADAGYRIVEREITLEVTPDQSKVYGDLDPAVFEASVSVGSLIYDDFIDYTATRTAGENAGSYRVTLADPRIVTKSGVDVTANYRVILKNGTFTIEKRRLKVSPKNQIASYLDGFNSFDIEVLDLDKNRNVTDAFVTSPTTGDRLTGKLSTQPTEDPLVFAIRQGTITVVNASGKNVSSNYSLDFDLTRTYTIERVEVMVRMTKDAILQKYYGDRDPLIAFDIEANERKKLGNLTLSDQSSIGRVQGEGAGEYNVYKDNSAHSFVVTDSGVDVTAYFIFTVRNVTYGTVKFKILPRPITVTIEDAVYENTGREIIPVIKYLNANGGRVSATVLALLKVQYAVPEMEYVDGDNEVTPVVVGDVQQDLNFELTVKPGIIKMVYLQNTVTATPLPPEDEIYKGRKYLLAGIMLYKPLKFYKLETANGEQPTREINISLPLDDTVKGDGLVAVTLYPKGSSKAFSFVQDGLTVVYADDAAYYVAISEVQEWFYVIWGLVIIVAAVVLYFLVLLIIKIAKKQSVKRANAPAKVKKGKNAPKGFVGSPKKGGALAAESENDSKATDDMFSSEAITEEPAPETAVQETVSIDTSESTNDLFSDTIPVVEENSAPAQTTEEDDLLAADVDISTDSMIAPATSDALLDSGVFEESGKKDKKKEKEDKKKAKEDKKKEKEDKKKKDNKGTFAPKGFMPAAFTPKGNKESAYAPTRSYKDDLFIEEEKKAEDDALLTDTSDLMSDDAIIDTSSLSSSTTSSTDDDELIVAKSSGFSDLDEETEKNDEGDGDLL